MKALPVVLLATVLFCGCGNEPKHKTGERGNAIDTLVRKGDKSLEEGLYIESLRNYLAFIRQTEEDTTVDQASRARRTCV